jgi:ABC-type multidrug transport system ATPase subunit
LPSVGRSLFQGAIVDGLRARGKTVILVTHALHFLPFTDRVLTLVDGHIAEDGTYDELVVNQGPFSRLMKEFGGAEEEKKEEQDETELEAIEDAAGDRKKRDKLTRMMSAQEVVDEKEETKEETEEAQAERRVEVRPSIFSSTYISRLTDHSISVL